MPTLYRQYRPQTFGELFGQEHISRTLQAAITKDKIAHAYLFHGPRGTGKTTTARILAKRLNCTGATNAEPCGECPLCKASSTNQNIDVLEIDAASNRGIDDIRTLKDGISSKPSMGKYKVYIIDEVHMLTNEAFTALLKTLEEPVQHAVFILATTELHKVPETILSRCQVYRFRRATSAEMQARITYLLKQEKRQADPAAIDFIIRRSDGCFRDAESLLGQLLTLHDKKIKLDDLTEFLGLPPQETIDQLLTNLIAGTAAPAIATIDTAFAAGFDPEQILKESILRARDAALAAVTGNNSGDALAQLPGAANRLPTIIRALLQALQDLAFVPQPLLAVHLAIVSVCTTHGAAPQITQPALIQPKQAAAPTPIVAFAPKPVPTPVVAAASVIATKPGVVSLEAILAEWPNVITKMKETNPVAATFLRAITPHSVEGSLVRLRANFALHRNFFDKPDNQKPLAELISTLMGTPLNVRCFLDQPIVGSNVSWSKPKTKEAGQDLLAAVKEVFGTNQA